MDLDCPRCHSWLSYRGDRWGCAVCHGFFVENQPLVAMIRSVVMTAWDLPRSDGEPGGRGCPICKRAMLVEVLHTVVVDRCDLHGVWFDDHELEEALYHASAPLQREDAWPRRLFGR